MTVNEHAALVLQQIDAALALAEKATKGPLTISPCGDELQIISRRGVPWVCPCDSPNKENDATFIATSRTLLPASLHCLKTAIEGLLSVADYTVMFGHLQDSAAIALETIGEQWEAGR